MKKIIAVIFVALLASCSSDTSGTKSNNQNNIPDTGANNAKGYAGLVINEIVAAGDPADWFELYNGSDDDISLNEVTFTDNFMTFDKASLSGTLGSEDYLVVEVDADGVGFGLGAKEELGIYASGDAIDVVDWKNGDSLSGRSFGRIPNGTGEFERLNTPSPGEANISNNPDDPLCGDDQTEGAEVCDGEDLGVQTCATRGFESGTLQCAANCGRVEADDCIPFTSDVVISEIVATGDDQIELTNMGSTAIDITGWSIIDRGFTEGDSSHIYVFPSGTTLEPGAFLVLTKGSEHPFGVGGGDDLTLRNDADEVVDYVIWDSPDADVSLCRQSDGSFDSCDSSTLGSGN